MLPEIFSLASFHALAASSDSRAAAAKLASRRNAKFAGVLFRPIQVLAGNQVESAVGVNVFAWFGGDGERTIGVLNGGRH